MVILGLGSNLGDRRQHLREAVVALSGIMTAVKLSHVFESPALLPEGAPKEWDIPYLNMAVAGMCGLQPTELLAAIKAIERHLGREPSGIWGPRVIDIDILAMDEQVLKTPELTIPHAELLKRDFVLIPMAQLAPAWVHPVTGQNIQQLMAGASHLTDTGPL